MDCLNSFENPLLNCFSCFCCSFLCCECNCLIFPSPRKSYQMSFQQELDGVLVKIHQFDNRNEQSVPYMELSNKHSRVSNKCFIYFHGNAEDLGHSLHFLIPILEACDVTIYAIEYPTYGCYNNGLPWWISDKIKTDAEDFYLYLMRSMNIKPEHIYVMGRSIGSGGASYLAAKVDSPLLILISPFDSIRSVAQEYTCAGCFLKQHFNNVDELSKFKGKLLIIHGRADEVIKYHHGQTLFNACKQSNHIYPPVMESPHRMSHNSFDIKKDICEPIKKIVQGMYI